MKVSSYIIEGFTKYDIEFETPGEGPGIVTLSAPMWNKSSIISALIRSIYSQDQVEAIINNHFLAIGEWLEKKLAGSEEKFIDEEYDKLQAWRAQCKLWADEALKNYPSIN